MIDRRANLGSRARPHPVLALLLVLGACARPEVAVLPDPALMSRAMANAASQVKRCYRAPRVGTDARQIVTRLRVRFSSDGMLAAMPVVVVQSGVTPTNRPYAIAMAQAAIEAVNRCVPLRLPPELYTGGWNEFDLTFAPRARA